MIKTLLVALLILMTAFAQFAMAETAEQQTELAVQLDQQAEALYQQGKYQEAIALVQQSLEILEKVLGPEHANTAQSLNNLAGLYSDIGRYDKALPLYQRALEIREKVFGPDHPETAISINNLALLRQAIGQYDQAIPLYQRALAIQAIALGSEHADIAISLNNLAYLYQEIGQYEKALPLYLRALAIKEKILGLEHLDTVPSINNLAELYQTLGQYDKALPLLQRALVIMEKALGPEHPGAAYSLNNLAVLYDILSQYDKALPLYQRALSIREKALGPEHPDTATSLNNLAMLYETLGQYEKALPLYLRALAIKEKAIGSEHPGTATSLSNLAALYFTLGQYTQALPLLQRALAIQEKTFGPDRIGTTTSLNNLALLHQALGQYDQAMPLYQRALAIREKAFGSEHTDTATSFSNLATLYEKLGQYDKALPMYQRAYRSALTARVPDTLKLVQANLGDYYTKQDNSAAAIFYLKGAVNTMQSIRAESRGLDKALQKSLLKKNEEIYKQLADLLIEAGRLTEALQVLSMLKEEEYFDFIRRDAQADSRSTRMSYSGAEKSFAGRLDKLGDAGAALVDQLNALNKQAKLGLTPEQEKQRTRIKAQLAEQAKQTIALLNELPQQLRAAPKQQKERDGKENLTQLQATLASLGHGAVMLHYVVTDTRVRIILATPKVLLAREAEIPEKELYRKIIAFRQVQQNPALDGTQLSLAELRTGGWKFNTVDLMTLSACETGLGGGKDANGREIEGFGVLAQRQGAKGVLATLWPVVDQSTAILMQTLYRLRQEKGLTKAEALREAQLALLTGKHPITTASRKPSISGSAGAATAEAPPYTPDPARPYAHPYYWAPFILMGNWL